MRFLISLVLSLAFLNSYTSVFASESTITVAPAILEVAADPGEKITRNLSVQNGGENSLPVSFAVQSLYSDPFEAKDNLQRDAKSWIKLEENIVVFEPQTRKDIAVSIEVPENAEAGGYYALLNVRGLSLENEGTKSSSIIVPEVSVAVFITVAGDLIESASINSINLVPLQSTPNSEKLIEFEVQNNGNVHGIVAPELVLEKNGEEEIIKLGSRVILPGDSATFSQNWVTPADYDLYSSYVRFNFGNENTTVKSSPEKLFITPPLTVIFTTAFLVWLGIFAVRHRGQIKPAINVLIKGGQ